MGWIRHDGMDGVGLACVHPLEQGTRLPWATREGRVGDRAHPAAPAPRPLDSLATRAEATPLMPPAAAT
jgi:hypothetical protein